MTAIRFGGPSIPDATEFRTALYELSADKFMAQGRFWTVILQDELATAYLDCPGEAVNTLKGEVIEELDAILDAAQCKVWKGLVITTVWTKPGIAGANVHEIAQLIEAGDGNAIVDAVEKVKQVLLKLSKLRIPTVAMMNGKKWLGGGFELSTFCDYRIGTPELEVGLPEVKLGIFPGAGGTQTVPRLMARRTDAIDFITGLKNLSAEDALSKGLIDEIADDGKLWDAVLTYCMKSDSARRSLRKRLLRRTKARRAFQTVSELKGLIGRRRGKVAMETLMPSLMERMGGSGRYWLLQSINQLIKGKTITSSALTAARLVMESRDLPLEEGLQRESQAFAQEALSPFARGATFLFTHKGGAREAFAHVDIPEVTALGIVGAGGPMGAGIAALYAAAPEIKKLVLIDIKQELLETTLRRIEKHLGKLAEDERKSALAKIVTATDYAPLADCQAIIEAVPEKVQLKQAIYGKIHAIMGSRKYFLFTNTSALDLDLLSEGMSNASQFGGMHFFNPPEQMMVVEVPRARFTSDETMAVAMHLASIAGKAPIPCANKPGFVVNRILGPYLVMTAWLLAMGVAPEEIDKAMKHAGAPMGPTVLLDTVGVDIAASVASTLASAFGQRLALPEDGQNVLKFLLDRKELGKKTGSGIYVWENGKPKRGKGGRLEVNPALLAAFPQLGDEKKTNKTMARESIQYLLLGAVINEALRAAEDGVVAPQHLKWIDVAFSFGTGVDAVYGGPLHHLDAWGVRTFERLTKVIANCGSESWRRLFAPCPLLTQLADTGRSFASCQARAADPAASVQHAAGEPAARPNGGLRGPYELLL